MWCSECNDVMPVSPDIMITGLIKKKCCNTVTLPRITMVVLSTFVAC